MIKKITTAINNAVNKYKQQRVLEATEALFTASETTLNHMLSLIYTNYKVVGKTIIEKTYEDPAPLTEFLAAFEKLSNHYTPAISQLIAAQQELHDFDIDTTPEVREFNAKIKAMLEDTNEEKQA